MSTAGDIRRVFGVYVVALDKGGEGKLLAFSFIEADDEARAREQGQSMGLTSLNVLARFDADLGAVLRERPFEIGLVVHKLGAYALPDGGAEFDGDTHLFDVQPKGSAA